MREQKLQRIPPGTIYSHHTTLLFSAEFLGRGVVVERLGSLLDQQGSLGIFPSATAFYLIREPGNSAAHDYLSRVVARGGGAAAALDRHHIPEASWMLYNALLVWPDPTDLLHDIAPSLGRIERELSDKRGAVHSTHFTVPDLGHAHGSLPWFCAC